MKTRLLALCIPVWLGSCGALDPVKDTSVHHLLDPLVPARSLTGARPAIAIARPALPSYLDRQELVNRSGEGQLQMNNYHLWAEPLAAAISRVTALNLGRLTNSLNVQPVENFVGADYTRLLEMRFSRFEPDAANRLVLECTWKLQAVNGPVAATHSFTTVVVPAASATPPAAADPLHGRVAAMNEALERLARQIARAL